MRFNASRAQRLMGEAGVDAIVCAVPRNLHYTTDFRASVFEFGHQETVFASVIPRAPTEEAVLVMPEGLLACLLDHPTWVSRIQPIEYLNTGSIGRQPEPVRLDPLQADVEAIAAERVVADLADNLVAGIVACLSRLGLDVARIAFDDLRIGQNVLKALPGIEMLDALDLLMRIRAVKTPTELDLLQHGARLNQAAVQSVLPLVRPGVPWADVAGAYRDYIEAHSGVVMNPAKSLQYGADYKGQWYPDVLMESNGWQISSQSPIIFEVWGSYHEYAFDFSRTVYIGTPPSEYLSMCQRISEAWRAGLEPLLRPGVSTSELYRLAMDVIVGSGAPTPAKTMPFFHCIGLDIVELPVAYPAFGKTKSFELEENMVVNCELLYFGHTLAPYHIETTFRITGHGAERWHDMPEMLTVLD